MLQRMLLAFLALAVLGCLLSLVVGASPQLPTSIAPTATCAMGENFEAFLSGMYTFVAWMAPDQFATNCSVASTLLPRIAANTSSTVASLLAVHGRSLFASTAASVALLAITLCALHARHARRPVAERRVDVTESQADVVALPPNLMMKLDHARRLPVKEAWVCWETIPALQDGIQQALDRRINMMGALVPMGWLRPYVNKAVEYFVMHCFLIIVLKRDQVFKGQGSFRHLRIERQDDPRGEGGEALLNIRFAR